MLLLCGHHHREKITVTARHVPSVVVWDWSLMGGCRFPEKRRSPRGVFKSSNLLGPPLGGAIWPGGANDLHLPTDGPAKGLAAGSQVDPGVHVLELDRLVALPVVCVAHHLSKTCIFSSLLLRLWPPTFHTSPVSPSPSSPKAETSCWLVSGEEKWWLCRFLEHKLIATFSAQFEAIQKRTSMLDEIKGGYCLQGKTVKSDLLVVRCSNRILWPQATGSPLLHRSSYSGP